MKIASSSLQFDSNHVKRQSHEIRESLRAWVGDRPQRQPAVDTVQLSDTARSAHSGEASAIEQGIKAAENDPLLGLIRAMVAMLTGKEVKVFDAGDLQSSPSASTPQVADPSAAPQPAGYGVQYDRTETYSETERTDFNASGVIVTADGQKIDFSLSLSMTRSYSEQSSEHIRLGDARKTQDPLVVNFNGNAARLTSQRFKFDLDADGRAEDINFVGGGSGFLALDRNGDGKVNNGSELFGAKSGNGFAELAVLDSDHNGWIDESDAAYSQLRVWTRDAAGKDILSTLKQANVGAIGLASAATPFDIKDSGNALQGQVRSSGVFLSDDGKAGTVQQVDLTV